MTDKSDRPSLVFHESAEVTFATNTFVNVPVILQYDDTPLIEVVQRVAAGYTTQFHIYDDSGTKLAVVKGTQIYHTVAGEHAGLKMHYPHGSTICERGGQELFRVDRVGPAAVRGTAELYTADGRFILAHPDSPLQLLNAERSLELGRVVLAHNRIEGARIGVQINSDGSMGFGVA